MTRDREKEIREWFTGVDKVTAYFPNPAVIMSPQAYCGLQELLAEIDQLQTDLSEEKAISSELVMKYDQLKAENKGLSENLWISNKSAVDLEKERHQLREQIDQMTQSVYHTPLNIFGDKSGGDLIAENTELRDKLAVAEELVADLDSSTEYAERIAKIKGSS